KEHILAVKEILRLSHSIKVRDTTSLAWVVKETGRNDAVCSGDSAEGFVKQWKKEQSLGPETSKENYLACFLREITTEYANGMGPDEFAAFKKNFEDELGKMVLYICEKTGLKPLFMPMHTFVIGNDDRDFMRRFVKTYLNDYEYELGDRVYSPQDILSVMGKSRFNLCMRFHSVLFADTLGVPFMAIDYTGGGKIKGYLIDRQREELMADRVDLAKGRWRECVDNALSEVFSASH
ncbi:MAG: polysaccharide pyruvyl transferase family protein, partial [Thermodesulfobacteriota bacterium]